MTPDKFKASQRNIAVDDLLPPRAGFCPSDFCCYEERETEKERERERQYE
jgi:hypothetical protein